MQRVWVVGNSGSGKTRLARALLSRDQEKSIMLWSWRHHHVYAERYAELARRSQAADQPDGARPAVVRLRSRSGIDAFAAGVGTSPR